MYYKSFKVNGQEDIDDFLLMVDETYYKYSELTRKDFFAQNSTKIFKTNILDRLEFEVVDQSLKKSKNLFFTNLFTVDVQILDTNHESSVLKIKHKFSNQKGELCAIIICNIHWYFKVIAH
ncbi:hypothetical protein [Winogradskyella sp.]|uniref:hypothetical protein n=1 Tax=Winogradskyella sp. TaxID=1883156 RepID=UPI0026014E12|nr:hypothetical protein [Winogradskyella sp.]